MREWEECRTGVVPNLASVYMSGFNGWIDGWMGKSDSGGNAGGDADSQFHRGVSDRAMWWCSGVRLRTERAVRCLGCERFGRSAAAMLWSSERAFFPLHVPRNARWLRTLSCEEEAACSASKVS